MADSTEEVRPPVVDMNGNPLREGDLVMVLLEKPNLVGFVTSITKPSILTSADKMAPGVLTVSGQISIPFDPKRTQILRQTAKLVNPAATSFVDNIIDKLKGPSGTPPKLTFIPKDKDTPNPHTHHHTPDEEKGAESIAPDPLPNAAPDVPSTTES